MGRRKKQTHIDFIGPVKKDNTETFTESALVGIIEGYLRKYHLTEVDALIPQSIFHFPLSIFYFQLSLFHFQLSMFHFSVFNMSFPAFNVTFLSRSFSISQLIIFSFQHCSTSFFISQQIIFSFINA